MLFFSRLKYYSSIEFKFFLAHILILLSLQSVNWTLNGLFILVRKNLEEICIIETSETNVSNEFEEDWNCIE